MPIEQNSDYSKLQVINNLPEVESKIHECFSPDKATPQSHTVSAEEVAIVNAAAEKYGTLNPNYKDISRVNAFKEGAAWMREYASQSNTAPSTEQKEEVVSNYGTRSELLGDVLDKIYTPSTEQNDLCSQPSNSEQAQLCHSLVLSEPQQQLIEILELRKQLPKDWKWSKCYELAYISSKTGREFNKKHWALKATDEEDKVASLGLISHDNFSTEQEFYKDEVVKFVEKSLSIIDTLLSMLNEGQSAQECDASKETSELQNPANKTEPLYRWVRASERLPDKPEHWLATNKMQDGVYVNAIIDGHVKAVGRFVRLEGKMYFYFDDNTIRTHEDGCINYREFGRIEWLEQIQGIPNKQF